MGTENGSLTSTEMDTHADTCCFGKHCYVVAEDTAMSVKISGFADSLGEVECPICSVAVAYDDERSHTTFILMFNQVLYVEEMNHNLVSPFQMRMNDIIVNDTPLRLLVQSVGLNDIQPSEHSIVIPEPELQIPLKLRGTVSYFNTRKPTEYEMSDENMFPRIIMTYMSPQWDPHDDSLAVEEETLRMEVDNYNEHQHPSRDRTIAQILTERVMISSVEVTKSVRRKGTVKAEELAKRWHVSLEVAKRTIDNTTQKGVRDFTHMQGSRRLRHLTQQLKYRPLNATCYTDTMIAKVPSLTNQYKCAQVYCTDFDWTKVYPMKLRQDAHYTLDLLHASYGAFNVMIPDNAKELALGTFRDKLRRAGTTVLPIEPYMHNQNRAESTIRELKRMYRRAMIQSRAPEVLWDHCFQLMGEIRSHTCLNIMSLYGQTPETRLIGDTSDISHLCQFTWYEYVWWLDPIERIQNRKLGHYLGPILTSGDIMCMKVLTSKGTVHSLSSVFPLSVEDRNSEVIKEKIAEYERELSAKLRDRTAGLEPIIVQAEIDDEDDDVTPEYDVYHDMDGNKEHEMPEADDLDYDMFNKYLSANVILPDNDGVLKHATVKRRARDDDGNLIGHGHRNPILDTSLYDVEFEDGDIHTYTANVIAEALYEQVDEEGQRHLIFEGIVDHKRGEDAIRIEDGFVTVGGRQHPKRTTRGWKMCVLWKDESTSWVALKDLKESHPIQVAEYAVAREIAHEPAFAWWVSGVLRRRNRIISAAKTKYARTNEKYGIELPHTLQRALEIDQETGTTFWADAWKKEMKTVFPAFEFLDEGANAPVGFQKIPCHLIFDVKMDLTRKARFVAGGHKTEPPASITYASVVSRESVRLAFLLAALNDLDILAGDVQGAYLNAPCREKVYMICGPEFGEYRGRIAVIRKALYGLKSSGFAWRSHLAETMRKCEFQMCYADNDVWMRPAVKSDGTKYYEYVLVYTDDILAVSMKPKDIMAMLDQHYLIKPSSIGPPTTYLGADIGRFTIEGDPKPKWTMSAGKYMKNQLKEIEKWLSDHDMKLKTRASSVLPSNYRPELDNSELCDADLHHVYQQKIGVLRWAVELGQINITAEVSMLAAYCAAPRIGHFNAMLHIFAFLKLHPRSRLVFDDAYVPLEQSPAVDFSEFYPDAHEDLPPNAPEPRGKAVQMIAFSDSDHAGDMITRRSRTGVLIFLNRAPILWYSKKQSAIETSTFGSEFMALKTATDLVKGLRYKLRMMGIPLEGSSQIRVDNMSVFHNASKPESVLKKKSNSIAYHYVRENVAAGTISIQWESTTTNLADMLTKIQSGPTRKALADLVLF